MDFPLLSDIVPCISARWSLRIGDPTLMGWATLGAYVFGGGACLIAALMRRRDTGFWIFLCLVLVLLGANKQLDLQSALTATGRCLSQLQGWYESRRAVQTVFIIGLLIAFGGVFLWMLLRMARRLGHVGIALLGFSMLLSFVALRAAVFHHVDVGAHMGRSVIWMLELGGIALITANALAAMGRQQTHL